MQNLDDFKATLASMLGERGRANDVILLAGSVVTGLAQPSSDVDIYLVRLDGDTHWSSLPMLVPSSSISVPVEVEEFGADAILARATMLKEKVGQSRGAICLIPQELLVRYSALLTAHVLIDPCDSWPIILQEMNPNTYGTFAKEWHAGWAERLLSVAVFALHVNDLTMCEAAIRAAAAQVVDSELATRGEIYFSPKYRFEKAARADLDRSWLSEFWEFHSSPIELDDRWLRHRVSHLVEWASIYVELAPLEPDVLVPRILEDAQLTRVGSQWVVTQGTRAWLVDQGVATLWEGFGKRMSWFEMRSASSAMNTERVGTIIRWFCEAGLLQLPPKLGRWATWI
jgi:hypothetical protein